MTAALSPAGVRVDRRVMRLFYALHKIIVYNIVYYRSKKMENTVLVDSDELAKIISHNSDAQRTQCRVDCRPEDGRLYFALQAEEQGDDFTIFDFYNCDMDLTYGDDLIEWIKDTIELPEGMQWV